MESRQDFLSAFSKAEVHNFTCETLKDRDVDPVVYIRSLSWAEKNRLRNSARMIVKRLCAVAEKSVKDEDSELIWSEDVKLSEEYILVQSMCAPNGDLLWDEDNPIKDFLAKAKPEFIEEILHNINEFNKLDDIWEPQEVHDEEVKKNLES
jgi:hypothetical protein